MNSCASAAEMVWMVFLRSTADLRPTPSLPCCTLPSQPEVPMPELASITFFRSGASELYLALFMAMTKVVV